jgi:hypothetical protein
VARVFATEKSGQVELTKNRKVRVIKRRERRVKAHVRGFENRKKEVRAVYLVLQPTSLLPQAARVFVRTYMLRVINADSKKKKKARALLALDCRTVARLTAHMYALIA